MRPAAAIVASLVLSATAFGAQGAPSEQVLADMGLSGLQILSDSEASAIRGAGFDGFDTYRHSIKLYHKTVKAFHKQVKKFDHKLRKTSHHKSHGMKPPKMSHGGSRW